VSENEGASLAPLILDASVLIEAARGDAGVMDLIQGYAAGGQPLILPVLAVTGAAIDIGSEDAAATLRGLSRLGNSETAPVRDAKQALALAAVIARTGLDPWDAHVAAVADAASCPILTLDAAKWREHAAEFDDPLDFVELADPEGD
jgi:predicted nucleic acid-binding protein